MIIPKRLLWFLCILVEIKEIQKKEKNIKIIYKQHTRNSLIGVNIDDWGKSKEKWWNIYLLKIFR